MIKKICGVILSLAIFISVLPMTVAADNCHFSANQIQHLLDEGSKSLAETIEAQVNSELGYLSQVGLLNPNIGSLSSISVIDTSQPYVGSSATIEYTINFQGHEECITFYSLSDSGTGFTSCDKAKGIENDVLILDPEHIFLDGERIEVTTSFTDSPSPVDNNPSRVSNRSSDRIYQLACPYGVAADYNVFYRNTKTKDINMKKALKDITFATAFTIVTDALGIGLVTVIFSQALYSILQESAPTSYGLSCEDYMYHHKSCGALSGGFISAYGKYVTKHVFTWYPKTNFQGSPVYTTEYEIYTIY